MDHDFNSAIVDHVAHRPWPMPRRPWLMTQTWRDLLFAHWRVDADHLRAHVPAPFAVDCFDGSAWLSVVAFRMTNVAPRGVPNVPWISEFPELNVRTYVRAGDRAGVYFFSLDAASTVAVKTARTLLNLPYYTAAMSLKRTGDTVEYESRRDDGRAEFIATYRPEGPPRAPVPGTLEYFLTERYCLYNENHRGAPYRLDIHHPPWPLQMATCGFTRNTMAAASGVRVRDEPPLLHFADRQDVVAWAPAHV